eukprot:1824644-Prymnesium_polylepis.2
MRLGCVLRTCRTACINSSSASAASCPSTAPWLYCTAAMNALARSGPTKASQIARGDFTPVSRCCRRNARNFSSVAALALRTSARARSSRSIATRTCCSASYCAARISVSAARAASGIR